MTFEELNEALPTSDEKRRILVSEVHFCDIDIYLSLIERPNEPSYISLVEFVHVNWKDKISSREELLTENEWRKIGELKGWLNEEVSASVQSTIVGQPHDEGA